MRGARARACVSIDWAAVVAAAASDRGRSRAYVRLRVRAHQKTLRLLAREADWGGGGEREEGDKKPGSLTLRRAYVRACAVVANTTAATDATTAAATVVLAVVLKYMCVWTNNSLSLLGTHARAHAFGAGVLPCARARAYLLIKRGQGKCVCVCGREAGNGCDGGGGGRGVVCVRASENGRVRMGTSKERGKRAREVTGILSNN